jgi:alkylation response protein AidB-like acyl-CoA dehydrogenase
MNSEDSATRMLEFLREYARRFLNSRLMDERRSLPPALVSDFAEAGLLGLQIPRSLKGQELSYADAYRVFTQLGAIDANLAVLCGVQNTLGTPPIARAAKEPLRQQVLPSIATGQALTTSAISELGVGTHVRGMTTSAIRNADGSYTINGAKKWVSLGGDARYVNVFAQFHDERGRPAGITGFLVDSRTPGFEVGPEMLTLGLRALPQYDLTFTDLRVPESALLGAEGAGLDIAKTAFSDGRVVLAACALGAAMRSLELAQRFARHRVIATGSMAENGRIRQVLAEAGAAVQAVGELLHVIATWRDAGETVPEAWYLCAKILGCELTWQAVDTALQMLAARGFLDTNTVGQHFRDFRLFRIFEGSTEAITVYLGAMMIRDPARFTALIERSDPRSELRELADRVAQVIADPPADAAARHIHASVAGDLICWTMMAMVTRAVATRSAMHGYTAMWAEQHLRDRLRRAPHHLNAVCLPTVAEFAEHVTGYGEAIGDIDQTRWPAEEWRADPLLSSR